MPNFQDPAEAGHMRAFYRNWRPTVVGRLTTRIFAFLAGIGLWSATMVDLQVRSRETGRLISHVLVPVRLEGEMFLVAMLGAGSRRVEDVRAAGGAAFLKKFRTRPVRLAEPPAPERGRVLRAWCQVATSGRLHLPVAADAPPEAFDRIAADYPVFRVTGG